jgi:hypothetical protein
MHKFRMTEQSTLKGFNPYAQPQAEGSPLVLCQQLIIKNFRRYVTYLEPVFAIGGMTACCNNKGRI